MNKTFETFMFIIKNKVESYICSSHAIFSIIFPLSRLVLSQNRSTSSQKQNAANLLNNVVLFLLVLKNAWVFFPSSECKLFMGFDQWKLIRYAFCPLICYEADISSASPSSGQTFSYLLGGMLFNTDFVFLWITDISVGAFRSNKVVLLR